MHVMPPGLLLSRLRGGELCHQIETLHTELLSRLRGGELYHFDVLPLILLLSRLRGGER